MFRSCEYCGSVEDVSDMIVSNNHALVCQNCKEEEMERCNDCLEYYDSEDLANGICCLCRREKEEKTLDKW